MCDPIEKILSKLAPEEREKLRDHLENSNEKERVQEIEKKVAHQKARFQGIYETISSGVVILEAIDGGKDFKIVDFNRAGEEIANVKREEIVGKRLTETFPAVEDYGFLGKMREVYRTGKAANFGPQYYSDDRREGWRSCRIFQLPSREIVTVFDDVTKEMEDQNRLVQKERLSAIGEMAAGVAHNLNNALQIILGNTELAMLEAHEGTKLMGYLEELKKAAAHSTELIEKLQYFASKNLAKGEEKRFNLPSLIEEAIEESTPLWKDTSQSEGSNISVKVEGEEALYIDGKPRELRYLFYSMLKNSIEALPKGGEVAFKVQSDDDRVYIKVEDNGVGMDKKTKERIFQPFFTTKGFDRGKGLGMSTAFAIVRDHGGEIYVKETRPGNGTVLEVVLPLKIEKGERGQSEKTEEGGESISRGGKILWVDDEEQIRHLGRRQLEQLGYQAHMVGSGKEALAALEEDDYYLLITDLDMPGMSGWELASKVREKYPSMEIALLSGWAISEEKRNDWRAHYILKKPVSLKDLKNLLEKRNLVEE